MKKSQIFMLAPLLFINLGTANADIRDSCLQEWQVDGRFGVVLAESIDLFPEARLSDYAGADEIDLEGSTCTMRVERPGYNRGPLANSENAFKCRFIKKAGGTASLSLSIDSVPFEAWGNRPSEDYWERENLFKPFQIHLKLGFENDINMRLAEAMKRRKDTGDPYFSSFYICGPDGVSCTGSVSFDIDPKDKYSASRLSCSIDTENGVIYKTRCVYFWPL